jgi:catechol 2,3-dioxygenase-like lactoylglutathione lyase family enzyme
MRMIVATACLALGLVSCKGDQTRSPLADLAKQCSHGSELSCPRPIFSVDSLRGSQRYYRDSLGFKLDWDHGDPPDFGSVSRGDAVIFLCERCQGNPGAWTMMFSPDVDRLYEELRDRNAIIKMPPTNMPWGMREMHVADPDGNVLRIGTGIDDHAR